jgi:hypothetical protein
MTHLRGLHYMLVSGEAIRPDGKQYANTDADWVWLQEDCAKAARWLGYMCNFIARRRFGVSLPVALKAKARELDEMARQAGR